MTISLDLAPFIQLSDEQFFELCRRNPELVIERSANGELQIITPTGGSSGRRNMALSGFLFLWARQDGTGVAFDSSTMFALPSGAMRSPDASWVHSDRWAALSLAEQDGFPALCPDFVAEILSPTDSLAQTRSKLEEFLANGARLGWLIDPFRRVAEVYRPGRPVETVEEDAVLSGEDVLAGLTIAVAELL